MGAVMVEDVQFLKILVSIDKVVCSLAGVTSSFVLGILFPVLHNLDTKLLIFARLGRGQCHI
jgi:hypothetical protein